MQEISDLLNKNAIEYVKQYWSDHSPTFFVNDWLLHEDSYTAKWKTTSHLCLIYIENQEVKMKVVENTKHNET